MLVVTATEIAERVGPFFAGLIVSFPFASGPAYVFLAMAHPSSFLVQSALSALVANIPFTIFLVIYMFVAPRTNTWISMGVSLGLWGAMVFLLAHFTWTMPVVIALNLLAYAVCIPLAPKTTMERPKSAAFRTWYELPLRGLAIGLFVALVVGFSRRLGPSWTGYVLFLPVNFIFGGLIVHARLGGRVATMMMASAIRTIPGMALGFLILWATAERWGSALGLLAALAGPLLWTSSLLAFRARPLAAIN